MNELGGNVTRHITLEAPVSDAPDADLALVDADSTPVATVTLPDATTATPSVTRTSLGYYTINYTTTQSGDNDLKWTGAVGGKPFVFTDTFYVYSPVDFVVSLDDVKRHLTMNSLTFTSDDELRDFILRAQVAVEAKVGPLVPTTVTSRVGSYGSWSGASLVLPVTPVISLTSVTAVGGSAVSGLTVSPSGVVAGVGSWFGYTPYDAVYVAGRTTCPADLYLAVLEMHRHLWDTQRGSSQTVWNNPEDDPTNSAPSSTYYLYPPRVVQLMAPYEQSGFA